MVNKFVAFVETVVKIPGEGVRRRAKFPGEGVKRGEIFRERGSYIPASSGRGGSPGGGGYIDYCPGMHRPDRYPQARFVQAYTDCNCL